MQDLDVSLCMFTHKEYKIQPNNDPNIDTISHNYKL